jgi:hypothetical protein
VHLAQAVRTDESFNGRSAPRSLRFLYLAQAVAEPDEASGDARTLARRERLPGSSSLLRWLFSLSPKM